MFGGTPLCTKCTKPVYAAEQTIGPGRKPYHKPCLACTICNKRLDSYNLVEHEEQPYCKNCHVKAFSPRDLRQANLPYAPPPDSPPPSPPRSVAPATQPLRPITTGTGLPMLKPTRSLTSPISPTFPRTLSPPPAAKGADASDRRSSQPAPNSGTILQFNPRHQTTQSLDLALSSVQETKTNDSDVIRPVPNSGLARNHTAETPFVAAPIPPLKPTATGTRYGAMLGGSISVLSSGTARKWGGSNPQCPRCDKTVYFAEQVRAVGKVFHRACLRCSECGTTLDSNRLRDHEGDPYCVRCYSKLHGPQGAGYALLGKAGG